MLTVWVFLFRKLVGMTGRISIIIPTYNEAASIGKLIDYLRLHGSERVAEIIVSDGNSTDDTVVNAEKAGAVVLKSPQKGRAAQMNHGAAYAHADILYFVHADTFPPTGYAAEIIEAVSTGYDFGRYRTKFDSSKFMLKINAWFTRFNWFICYGGDQTLFVTRTLFEKAGGFKHELMIMEEFEFCDRLMKGNKYKIFTGATLVSARKYDGRSWLQVQMANRRAVQLFKKGASQEEIVSTYKKMLKLN